MRCRAVLLVVAACTNNGQPPDDAPGEAGLGSVRVNAPDAADVVIAYRAGSAPWTIASGADAPFDFPASGSYSVAIACPHRDDVVAYQLTTDEVRDVTYDRGCSPPVGSEILSGSITVETLGRARVAWGSAAAELQEPNQGPVVKTYSTPATGGVHDVIAGWGTLGPSSSYGFSSLVFLRDVADPTGLPAFDHSMPGAPTTQYNATIGNNALSNFTTRTTLVTANGTRNPFVYFLFPHQLAAVYVTGTALRPSDRHELHIFTMLDGEYLTTTVRSHEMPARVPDFVLDTAPSFVGTTATWTTQPGAIAYRLEYRGWTVHVSASELDATHSLSLPVLDGVAGWNANVGLTSTLSIRAWAVLGDSVEDVIRAYPDGQVESRARSQTSSL